MEKLFYRLLNNVKAKCPTSIHKDTKMIEYYTLLEIKTGINATRPSHEPFAPFDQTWWDYIVSTYKDTGKVTEFKSAVTADATTRSTVVTFRDPASREEFLSDSTVIAGYDALIAYDGNNKIKVKHVGVDVLTFIPYNPQVMLDTGAKL